MSFKLAGNVKALAMWWHLKNVSPEPQPNRITNDEDNYKSSIVRVKPELLLIANKKLKIYSSPRHIAKPPVGCRYIDFGTVSKLLLIK